MGDTSNLKANPSQSPATEIKAERTNTSHVEVNLSKEQQQLGHLANQEDHDLGIYESLRKYPGGCAWCAYACWTIILCSFELQAAGSVLGIPTFRKDFGSEYNGNYVLPAAWQSAFNAAPVASATFGVLGAAAIADTIGRKWTMVGALVVSFAAITIEFVSTTNPVFFGGKFLNGFATGTIQAVMTAYIGEVFSLHQIPVCLLKC
jgi:SP family general alpha glucoside:H+ symporter-like MFS transporter